MLLESTGCRFLQVLFNPDRIGICQPVTGLGFTAEKSQANPTLEVEQDPAK
jgi:hypothetical protein